MHVLYLCEEYPPPVIGGIGQVVKLLAEGLVERGHRATVVGQYWINRREEYEQKGVRVIKLPRPRHNKLTRNDLVRRWLLARDVRKLVRDLAVDIVESPSYMGDGAFLGRRVAGFAPHILRVHGTDSAKPGLDSSTKRFSSILERRAAQNNQHIVLVSRKAGDAFLAAMGVGGRSYAVIPNPVDTTFFQPAPVEINNPSLLCIGRLDELKGALHLAVALPSVFEHVPNLQVRFAGADGKDFEENRKGSEGILVRVGRHWDSQVQFLGRLSHEDLVREINSATVCILPSLYENFPCAVLEAMACGKPVIASSRAHGAEVLVDGDSGVLIDPLEHKTMADAVVDLFNDEAKCQYLGRKARDLVVRRCSLDVVMETNIRYYQACLAGNSPTGELLPLAEFC